MHGLKHRHAVAQQRAQNPGEPGHRQTADQRPESGDPKLPTGQRPPNARLPPQPPASGHDARGTEEDHRPVVRQRIGRAEEDLRGKRQLDAAVEILELRHEKDECGNDDTQTDEQQYDRVDKVAEHLGPHVSLLFEERAEPCQHLFEKSAALTGPDHGDLDRRKDILVLGHGIAQSLALSDVVGNGGHDGRQPGIRLSPPKQLQRTQQRHADAQQVRELPIDGRQVAGGHAPLPVTPGVDFAHLHRREVARLELDESRLSGHHGQRAGDLHPKLIASNVLESRHSAVGPPVGSWVQTPAGCRHIGLIDLVRMCANSSSSRTCASDRLGAAHPGHPRTYPVVPRRVTGWRCPPSWAG